MELFDNLDEKAREFAAKARAALENPDELLAKARERVEEAVQQASAEIREFAADPKAEFLKLRDQLSDLLDCESEAAASTPEPGSPAPGDAAPEPPATEPPPAG
ncbi:MAG: hypothetical protein V4503_08310 [Gemmatimonadota bacterium]